jgi:hypothetical protein
MSRRHTTQQAAQKRYESKARRVLIRKFRMLTTVLSNSEIHREEPTQLISGYKTTNTHPGYYPNFPVIIQGNGEPWTIANLYLTTKLERDNSYESRTFRTIADHLLDYLRFLEDEGIHFLYLPKNNRLKATFRYNQHLIKLRDDGKLASSTASARMNAVVNFYRGAINWGLVEKTEFQNIPFEDIFREMHITSLYGTESIVRVKSHNLAIKKTRASTQPEYITDGGPLRPLTVSDQEIVLASLLDSSREYQLMFYFALFTGARAQTVGTLRIGNLNGKLDKDGYLRLRIGAGTLIDTKRGHQMTLLVPGWLVNDMKIYSKSSEAMKRRRRSFYRLAIA